MWWVVGYFVTIWACAGTKPTDRRLDTSTVESSFFANVLLRFMLKRVCCGVVGARAAASQRPHGGVVEVVVAAVGVLLC